MDKELLDALSATSSYLALLPLIVGIYRWSNLSVIQRRILFLVLGSAFFELLGKEFAIPFWDFLFGYGRNNLPGAHFFAIFQFAAVLWIYKDIVEQIGLRWLFSALLAGFTIFAIYNGIWLDQFRFLNPHARALQSLILLPIIFSYFYRLLKRTDIPRLEKEPLFWASAGFTIYFSGSFLIFLLGNYLLEVSTPLLRSLFGIHSLLNILLLIFLAVALWIRPQK